MVEEYYYMSGEGGASPPEGARALYRLPEGSLVLRNPKGPAPGLFVEGEGCYIVCLPGSLAEVSALVEEEADPYLREVAGAPLSACVHVMTKTWDEELLRQVAREISDSEPWIFAQVKRNVFSREGWGLTVTVFARDAGELSEKLARAVEFVEGELRKRGIAYEEKDVSGLL